MRVKICYFIAPTSSSALQKQQIFGDLHKRILVGFLKKKGEI